MLLLQILRLAVIVVVAVAWLARGQWTHFFVWVRLNLLVFVLAYVALTVTIRVVERRRRARARSRIEAPWICQVCETENPGTEVRCSKCTVPRPRGAS